MMNFRSYIIKRHIEDVIIFPFILLGKIIARLYPLKQQYDIFFFFPFFHIGGAEKVHAEIANAIGNGRCIIFFTRHSANALFYEQFQASGCVIRDLSKYTDNKLLYFLNLVWRGIIASYINSQSAKTVVFNGQCNFAYKIAPWIKRSIPQIELIHSFNSFSWIRLPFLPFITRTIMISKVRITDHLKQYRQLGVPEKYNDRIEFILNGIDLPAQNVTRNNTGHTLNVLYVGRGTPEKRVHLIAGMAQKMHGLDNNISFTFLGDAEQAIAPELHQYASFHPYESDPDKIRAFYQKADVLIIVSDTEGFPMVIMEAMAWGCAIVATPVGDITVHIQQGKNGFLFSTVEDETLIIEQGVQILLQLKNDPALLSQIADNNSRYALANFGMEQFKQSYSALIKSVS